MTNRATLLWAISTLTLYFSAPCMPRFLTGVPHGTLAAATVDTRRLREPQIIEAQGPITRQAGTRHVQGVLTITLEFPSRLRRDEKFTAGEYETSRTWILDGETTRDTRLGPTAQESTQLGELQKASVRLLRLELRRWSAALLGSVPEGTDNSRNAGSDEHVLVVREHTGGLLRLFVSPATKLPMKLEYQGPTPAGLRRSEDEPSSTLQQSSARRRDFSTHVLLLSGHKNVSGVTLPYVVRHLVAEQFYEEWRIERYRVNPRLDPKTFRTADLVPPR